MIMLTVTKPRRKLKRLLKGGALLLLLGVVVPGLYHSLQAVGAMSLFASGENVQTEAAAPNQEAEQAEPPQAGGAAPTAQTQPPDIASPQEPVEPGTPLTQTTEAENVEEGADKAVDSAEKPGLLERLKTVIFGEQAAVQPY